MFFSLLLSKGNEVNIPQPGRGHLVVTLTKLGALVRIQEEFSFLVNILVLLGISLTGEEE